MGNILRAIIRKWVAASFAGTWTRQRLVFQGRM